MGFPTWTLVGMGVTAVLALLMTGLAYLAQSPRVLLRLGLSGYRLDLRVKHFTAYTLASLILMLGFFLAGVPLNSNGQAVAAATATSESSASAATSAQTGAMSAPPESAVSQPTTSSASDPETDEMTQTPASGAFGGPPPGSIDEVATVEIDPTATPGQAGPSATPASSSTTTAVPPNNATGTATATFAPTATSTPPPTETPSPTITPTPVEGITATISTNGSTLWVRRSPGGQQLVIVQDNEIVLVENGRANQGGILWREIRTLNGVLGWVQAEFLIEE